MLRAIRRSLRAKVVVIVLATAFVALSVSTVVLLTYEVNNYALFLQNDAQTQAQLMAQSSTTALEFQLDRRMAEETLELLENRRGIIAAAIYLPNGDIAARYLRDGVPASFEFPAPGPDGATVDGGTIRFSEPIEKNGERLGTVYIESTYDVTARLRDYLVILISVMFVSLLVAALISLLLAGSVTGPLRALTDVARKVIERRDFTLRAKRTTDDEIGVFVDAFNAMLAEVGQRAAALEQSNRALQQETEERRQAVEALRVADQHKDEFLATLAHELRNPLAPMVNAISLLQMPEADAPTAQRAQGIIARQLAQMVRLVDDLLDVSRITSGKLTIRKQAVDLGAVLQNAIDTARPLLDERRHTLTLSLPKQPIFVQGDAVRLAQVFSNLLNNAAKYSEAGREITVTAEIVDSSVRLRFDDQGIGLEADALPKIFQMFAQGGSIERSQAGLGVGLALARRLVELHGGTITAASEGAGRGSSFTVTLPVMAALARSSPVETRVAPPPSPPGQPLRILLVDDNVDFVTSLALLLESIGHEVRVAHNAADALDVGRELRPHFGFLDLGLPEVSGYQLARALHEQPETQSTVLVAVSGWGQARDRERSRDAGFSLHLVKPVELNSIQAALTTLARSR